MTFRKPTRLVIFDCLPAVETNDVDINLIPNQVYTVRKYEDHHLLETSSLTVNSLTLAANIIEVLEEWRVS